MLHPGQGRERTWGREGTQERVSTCGRVSVQERESTQGRESPQFSSRVVGTGQAAMGLRHQQLRRNLSTGKRLCLPLSYCKAGGDEPVKPSISQRVERRICVFIGRRDRCERRAVTRLTASGHGATRSRARVRQPRHFPPRDFDVVAGAGLTQAETIGAGPPSDLSAAQKPRKLSFINCWPLALLLPATRAAAHTGARFAPW